MSFKNHPGFRYSESVKSFVSSINRLLELKENGVVYDIWTYSPLDNFTADDLTLYMQNTDSFGRIHYFINPEFWGESESYWADIVSEAYQSRAMSVTNTFKPRYKRTKTAIRVMMDVLCDRAKDIPAAKLERAIRVSLFTGTHSDHRLELPRGDWASCVHRLEAAGKAYLLANIDSDSDLFDNEKLFASSYRVILSDIYRVISLEELKSRQTLLRSVKKIADRYHTTYNYNANDVLDLKEAANSFSSMLVNAILEGRYDGEESEALTDVEESQVLFFITFGYSCALHGKIDVINLLGRALWQQLESVKEIESSATYQGCIQGVCTFLSPILQMIMTETLKHNTLSDIDYATIIKMLFKFHCYTLLELIYQDNKNMPGITKRLHQSLKDKRPGEQYAYLALTDEELAPFDYKLMSKFHRGLYYFASQFRVKWRGKNLSKSIENLISHDRYVDLLPLVYAHGLNTVIKSLVLKGGDKAIHGMAFLNLFTETDIFARMDMPSLSEIVSFCRATEEVGTLSYIQNHVESHVLKRVDNYLKFTNVNGVRSRLIDDYQMEYR